MRRALAVRARCEESATIVVEVYRRSVWLSVLPSFMGEGILDPDKADSLAGTLVQAAREARGYQS